MTTTASFKQSSDLNPALELSARGQLTGEKLLGCWVNTNQETRGIRECVVTQDGEGFGVRVFGVGDNGMIEWPTTGATPLANLEEEAGQRTVALVANCEFDFMRIATHIRVNKGVLVIVLFVTFTDDSGRSNYLNREFFSRHD